jgi:hypothetical protein
MNAHPWMLAAVLLPIHGGTLAAEPSSTDQTRELLVRGGANWSDLVADTTAGSVSAAGLLGVSGESVTTVENVRHLVVALQGMNADDSGTAMGVSITPARTSLAPMNLSSYADSWLMRLLGSLTFSYAQGPATIEHAEYRRKAYAIDTNFYLWPKDDPVLAYALAIPGCGILQRSEPPVGSAPDRETERRPSVPAEDTSEAKEASDERAAACRAQAIAGLRWNRSQISISYGDAKIEAKAISKSEESFGRTLAVSVIYGFDHFDGLRDGYALSLAYRRSDDEPVLATLAEPQTVFKDSSLLVARLSGGNSRSRLLLEASDASSRNITASQRAFKNAVGIDYKITDNAWLNLRVGRQYKIQGSGKETGSLLSLSYSPAALLAR